MPLERPLNPVDFAVLTVAGTAVGLDSGSPALLNGKVSGKTVRGAFFTVAGNDVVWRSDGTDPTDATDGHTIQSGDNFSLTGANYKTLLSRMKFIQATAAGTVLITYFD